MYKHIPQRILIAVIFFWSQASIPVGEIKAQTQQQGLCQKLLDEAQQEYYNGNFETTIEIIKRCLIENNITENERFKAYKILAQTYIAKDYSDAAIQVIRKLLEMNPDFTPTIEQEPPQFVNMVAQIKAELAIQKVEKTTGTERKTKTWLWVAAGSAAVIAGIAVILISMQQDAKQEEEKPSLPEPPEWP